MNFVRQVVEEAGCLFKEINLQHDFGHDATIILVFDGEVQPREIALQIKSGRTYNRGGFCRIPIKSDHLTYWSKHDLQTLGVVYDPSERGAYWVDLKANAKAFLRDRDPPKSLLFRKSLYNRFHGNGFRDVLLPILMHKTPNLSLEEAIAWSRDLDFETHSIGVRVLLSRHYIDKVAWEELIDLFASRDVDDLSHLVPAAFSKMLGNWDLSYTFTTATIPPDVKEFARTAVTNLGVTGLAKLLEFLDHDEGWDFSRGTLGRALLVIFEAQEDMTGSLRAIAEGPEFRDSVRRMAKELHKAYSEDSRWYWG
ncbi:MAG TPA: DUF4365 domain-containing protein [Allosphingosinicella sp.]|nr:DUF4365 domain-containing protein [Allosphingosinicella sp.]